MNTIPGTRLTTQQAQDYFVLRHNLPRYCIPSDASLLEALQRIDDNQTRVVFVISHTHRLEGVLSDGDLRREMIASRGVDLNRPVSDIMRRTVTKARVDAPPVVIRAMFGSGISMVPLLDDYDHLVAIATLEGPEIAFGSLVLSPRSPTMVIAEIGNNHNGSLNLAKEMIARAVEAGADCVKFQMRHIGQLYRNSGDHNDIREDLGAQYTLDLLSRFNLLPEQLFEAFDYCRQLGVLPLCTPWDLESVQSLEDYGIVGYKISSADLTNHDLLAAVADTGKPLLLSTGMSTETEILEAVTLLRQRGAHFVPLHCNSTYPAPFKDVNLAYLKRLSGLVGGGMVGYSGHERGYHIAVAAIACGAKVIEKHFTLDRNMEGNDHKVSLLPDEFAEMVRAIRDVEEAMGEDRPRTISQGELINRETLAKSLIAASDITKGQIITADVLAVKSPGRGLQPNRRSDLIGRLAHRDIVAGDFFYLSDLAGGGPSARPYRFRRPWGVPVRYHDVAAILQRSNPDLVEYHLSYKDVDVDITRHFNQPFDIALTVHSPEAFAGDHVMDLCSDNEEYRRRSIAELERVITVARSLRPYHLRAPDRIPIITNVGGFSFEGPIANEERPRLYERLLDSLSRVDMAGVEILPQTMPPFPWHFGGQRYHNLFVAPDEIEHFCRASGMRVCLDVSHSKLACAQFKWSFDIFIEQVGPHTAHLHLADAAGVDGEGLQIGVGDINFAQLARQLDAVAPAASFIPEVWQGHKNEGEGFWSALELLEQWF